jgi:type I restriction enzyme, S subunit
VIPKASVKRTEIGTIPLDWSLLPLDSISNVTSGKRLPLGCSLTNDETPHPYIRVTDMRPGTVSLAEIKYVPSDVFPAIRRYRIYEDEIFISVAGTLGIVGKVPPELNGANLTENADRITAITCHRDYLLHVLASPLIQKTIDSLQTVGAQPKLALERIRKFSIPVPPTRTEQETIAEALSDADALIESLEQLLVKKRQIKQGTMQELLTGKRRLPGFDGEWRLTQLGQVGEFLKGSGVTREQAQSGQLPCVRYGEIYTTHHDYIRSFYSWISLEVAKTATPLRRGDLLFAGSGETKEEIGKCVAFLNEGEAYAGGDIVILRPVNFDSLFLGYLMNTVQVIRQKASRGQGDAVVHISARALAQVTFLVPALVEQTAIATILSDMDADFAALQAKLAKARHIKQGMMQQLLTGQIRLV